MPILFAEFQSKFPIPEEGFQSDLRSGFHIFCYPSGRKYEGEWLNGNYHGFGKLTFEPNEENERLYYIGQWQDGLKHGKGKMVWHGEHVYDGEWENDERSSYGTYDFGDGNVYQGEWNEKNNGFGKFTYDDSDERKYYIGTFKDDLYHGQGVLCWKNGQRYEGAWHSGERNGFGTLFAHDGSIIYQGIWAKNERERAKKFGFWPLRR